MGPPRSGPLGVTTLALAAILGGVAAIGGAAGCEADLPRLAGRDAGLDEPCSPFADLIVELKPAGGDNDPAAGMAALGEPDGAGVTITPDTVLTVAFVGLGGFQDAPGPDLGIAVIGAPEPDTEVAGYVSGDGVTFEYAGALGPENTTLDLGLLAGTPTASYVRLVGVGVSGAMTVDSIEAIEATCEDPL